MQDGGLHTLEEIVGCSMWTKLIPKCDPSIVAALVVDGQYV